MAQGIAPDNYTFVTYCEGCRDYVLVPFELGNNSKVFNCMWCSNRAKGLPVPKVINSKPKAQGITL